MLLVHKYLFSVETGGDTKFSCSDLN